MPIFLLRLLSDDSGETITRKSFLEKLFPNLWDALAVFLAFIILLVVVFFVAYKPVKKLIKQRGDYVEGKMKNAEQLELEANEKVKDAEEKVIASNKEAMDIIEQAKKDALNEKALIKEQAKKEADQEVIRAKEEIQQEIEKSKDEIHEEIVNVALDASKKVLSREVSKEDNEKLIDEFIDDLKSEE